MKRKFGNEYDFVPNTYLLSSDYERAKAAVNDAGKNEMFILKPVNNACGRGIKVINKKDKLKKN
jgi:glutathione synthase/RimK-type ligase-like ATP-grasp enzyme